MSRTKKTIQEQNKKPEMIQSQVVDKLEADITELVEQYKQTLDDPEELTNNNGLFMDMLKYIYKHYIKYLLKNDKDTSTNGNRYDYGLLNDLFNIYTTLVYRYKKNNRPLITEFSLFVNVDRQLFNNIRAGNCKKASETDIHNVKNWFYECETALQSGGSVFEIFLLKSCYGYNDNLAAIPIESQNQALAINQLPDLSKNDPKKVIEDKQKSPQT